MARNKYGGVNDMPSGWTKTPEHKRVYMLWFYILRRCYDVEQQKRIKGKSYIDCKVCERWFYLSLFYEDIQRLPGYKEWKTNGKMSIDKDLFSKGAKEYGPQTCCFIPISVNITEMNRRNPGLIRIAQEANKTKYVLSKGEEKVIFSSEKEACKQIGVHQCTIASCYRRGSKCKGYTISKMDGGEEDEK